VSSDPYSRLKAGVTFVSDRPLTAITRLDTALDDALTATGLSETFDVTGRALQVTTVDRLWREAAGQDALARDLSFPSSS
jgi:hypothetical protein